MLEAKIFIYRCLKWALQPYDTAPCLMTTRDLLKHFHTSHSILSEYFYSHHFYRTTVVKCIESVFRCLSSLHDVDWYRSKVSYFYPVNTAPTLILDFITAAFLGDRFLSFGCISNTLANPRGGHQGRSNFFYFLAVFGKNLDK